MTTIIEERVDVRPDTELPDAPDDLGADDAQPDELQRIRLRRARQRVEAMRGFLIHLGIYLTVNLGLLILNLVLIQVSGNQTYFFFWPLVLWGIGLLIHGFVVFGADRFLGPEWEERKIREYLAKQQ